VPLHQRVGHGVQLRRRGVTTVVIGGVATNMDVESTARAARTSTAMRW
jgi:nicotinamidase-related amidase